MKNIDIHAFYLIAFSLMFAIMVATSYRAHLLIEDRVGSIATIARNSHFVGCARVTMNFQYCKELSESYEEQIRKDLGL